MSEHDDRSASRRPRADAARNRALVLETAKRTFAKKGSGASLEEIARVAGVGIGTLYRHFPTRDALIEAVYRHEIESLAAAARKLATSHAPVEALRAWLLLFVGYLATKHGMSGALGSLVNGTSELYASSGVLMMQTIRQLFGRAVESGEIRGDVDPVDLLRALAGLASIGSDDDWVPGAERLVDVLVTGVRTA